MTVSDITKGVERLCHHFKKIVRASAKSVRNQLRL